MTNSTTTSRHSAAGQSWMSWTGLVYYGETLGFVLAWIAGIAVLTYSSSAPSPATPKVSQVASTGGVGIGVDR